MENEDDIVATFIELKTTPALFTELRKIENLEVRQNVLKKVYEVKMKEYRKSPMFYNSEASSLVDHFHAYFREEYDKILQRSTTGKVQVGEFRSVTRHLHEHHGIEDRHWFPHLKQAHPELENEIDILESDHAAFVTMECKIERGSYEALVTFVRDFFDHLRREELLTVPSLMDGTGSFY